jgi:ketosteroid isomerase-like protein
MDKAQVDDWLDRYIEAWKSYDRDEVVALFTDDAEYRWHPYDAKPAVGPEAIYEGWIAPDARDEPVTYEAEYSCIAVDGDVAVATGSSTYYKEPNGDVRTVYDNCFVMRFAPDGRCSAFTEWFMERPD